MTNNWTWRRTSSRSTRARSRWGRCPRATSAYPSSSPVSAATTNPVVHYLRLEVTLWRACCCVRYSRHQDSTYVLYKLTSYSVSAFVLRLILYRTYCLVFSIPSVSLHSQYTYMILLRAQFSIVTSVSTSVAGLHIRYINKFFLVPNCTIYSYITLRFSAPAC